MNSSHDPIATQADVELETSIGHAAYQRMLPLIRARGASATTAIMLDNASMTTTVLGSVHAVEKIRPSLASLPDVSMERIDQIRDCANALVHVNVLYLRATRPPEALAEKAEKASRLRARLYPDVLTLARRGLVAETDVAGYVGNVGYKTIANDLVLLGDVLQSRWAELEGKTAITRAEVNEANELGFELLEIIGIRDRAQASAAEIAQLRLLAYNLLLDRYDELRRAVIFVRWHHHDADAFAPSLYAGRSKRRGDREEQAPSSELPKPEAPTPKVERASSAGLPDDEPFDP